MNKMLQLFNLDDRKNIHSSVYCLLCITQPNNIDVMK